MSAAAAAVSIDLSKEFESRRTALAQYRAGGSGRAIQPRSFDSSSEGFISKLSQLSQQPIQTGKRSGVTLIRTNKRDSHGFEDLEDIFGLSNESSNYFEESQTDQPFDANNINNFDNSNNNAVNDDSFSAGSPIAAAYSASKSSSTPISAPFSTRSGRPSNVNSIAPKFDEEQAQESNAQPKRLNYNDQEEPLSGAEDDSQPKSAKKSTKATKSSKISPVKPLKSVLTPTSIPRASRRASNNVSFSEELPAGDEDLHEGKYSSARRNEQNLAGTKRKATENEAETLLESDNFDIPAENEADFQLAESSDNPNEEVTEIPKVEKSRKTKVERERARRRQTQKLIDEAQSVGALDEMEAEILNSKGRPKRMRLKPLQYWRGEHIQHKRTMDGMGAVLPVISQIVKPADTPQIKKTKKASKAKPNPPAAAGAKREENSSEDDQSESALNSSAAVQFSAVEVFDYESKSVTPKYVIKSSSQVALENLAGAAEAEELPSRELPKGGKAFDEAGFSTGILLLPPGATKELEVANFIESFYVVQAAANSLQLTLHDSTRLLSAGDHFYVPYNDTYSLMNASQNKPIELHFTLIKPSVASNREIAQSTPARIR